MADYVIGRQSRDVHLVYRCSTCNNPVSFSSTIFSAVKVSSSMFNDTTVEDAAKYVMDQLEEDINKSFEKKTLLGIKAVTQEELVNNLQLINIDPSSARLDCEINSFSRGKAWFLMEKSSVCPICGSHEVWQQKKVNAEDLMRLEEDNFPKVYHSNALAGLFIKLKLQEKNERIISERLIPDVVEKAQKEYHEKECHKREIEEELLQGLDQNQLDSITKDMDVLNDQLRQLKAFDFKARKSINQQIKEKQKEIDEINEKWKQKENRLKQESRQLDFDMEELAYLAFGTNGTAEIVFSQRASAYRLIVNAQNTNPTS